MKIPSGQYCVSCGEVPMWFHTDTLTYECPECGMNLRDLEGVYPMTRKYAEFYRHVSDKYDKQVAELLPCECDGAYFDGNTWKEWHPKICPASRRPAVAALLRERDRRIEGLQRERDKHYDMWQGQKARTELLCQQLADRDRRLKVFAEKYPCHCAENYPGATEYHGQDCANELAQEFVAQWLAQADKEIF